MVVLYGHNVTRDRVVRLANVISGGRDFVEIREVHREPPSFVRRVFIYVYRGNRVRSKIGPGAFLILRAYAAVNALPAWALVVRVIANVRVLVPFAYGIRAPFRLVDGLYPTFRPLLNYRRGCTIVNANAVGDYKDHVFRRLCKFGV